MHLAKVRLPDGTTAVGVVSADQVRLIDFSVQAKVPAFSSLLHAAGAAELIAAAPAAAVLPLSAVALLPPVDRQEVWAAGVTYKRSEEARKRESVGAANFYDRVYTAERPELFLKAPARRVIGPGGTVRVRRDSRWSVPEPELALVISPQRRIVGYTIGNDMSARDIEGENPLYLPQAKIYDGSCALGPWVTLAAAMPPPDRVSIRLTIERGGTIAFTGETTLAMMARTPEELVAWLTRETSFPDGAVLLTGTGVVPPDDFTLATGDCIHIDVTGIGRLSNVVG